MTNRLDELLKKFVKKKKPTDDELLKIILRWDGPVKEEAWQKLKERRNNDSMVLVITKYTSFAGEAWLILKKEDLTKNQLKGIVGSNQTTIRNEATFKLLELIKQNPDEDILRFLVKSNWGWDTGEEAARMLIAKNPDEMKLPTPRGWGI